MTQSSYALITGASSGIGFELAKCFARQKINLVLVARTSVKLEKLARDMEREHGIPAHVIAVDLSEPDTRLLRAVQKKHHLRHIYAAMEKDSLFEAIGACDTSLKRNPHHTLDILKLKAGLLLSLGNATEAETIYRQVLTHRPLAWAQMGIAVALRDQGNLEPAAKLAREVIDENKEFLAAYDFLANVLQIMDQPDKAQQVLENAAAISPNNSIRQRLVGDIAVRNQDLVTASKAYSRVVARHQGSSISTVDAYANLGRTLVATDQHGRARWARASGRCCSPRCSSPPR